MNVNMNLLLLIWMYLNPSSAEFFISIPQEPTNISSDHRNPKNPRIQNTRNRIRQIIPARRIIPGPMGRILPGADEGRPSQHKRPFSGDVGQRQIRGLRLQKPVQIVHVVLRHVAVMQRRRRHGSVADGAAAAAVVDLVGRIVERGVGGGGGGDEVGELVHVDPEAVDGEEVEEGFDLVGPEGSGGGVEEVWEVDFSRPDLALVRRPVALDVDVGF